jgi:hypothetical protein
MEAVGSAGDGILWFEPGVDMHAIERISAIQRSIIRGCDIDPLLSRVEADPDPDREVSDVNVAGDILESRRDLSMRVYERSHARLVDRRSVSVINDRLRQITSIRCWRLDAMNEILEQAVGVSSREVRLLWEECGVILRAWQWQIDSIRWVRF